MHNVRVGYTANKHLPGIPFNSINLIFASLVFYISTRIAQSLNGTNIIASNLAMAQPVSWLSYLEAYLFLMCTQKQVIHSTNQNKQINCTKANK